MALDLERSALTIDIIFIFEQWIVMFSIPILLVVMVGLKELRSTMMKSAMSSSLL